MVKFIQSLVVHVAMKICDINHFVWCILVHYYRREKKWLLLLFLSNFFLVIFQPGYGLHVYMAVSDNSALALLEILLAAKKSELTYIWNR